MLALVAATLLAQLTPIPLSDGGPLGLDDLRIAPDGRFVIPTAELGEVRLLTIAPGTPPTETRVAVGNPGAPHKIGSAVVADGLIAAGDRKQSFLWVSTVADPASVPAATPLPFGPDYVRLFGDEVWVTEPSGKQIEVYSVTRSPLALNRVATLAVPGNPESLEAEGGVAYTLGEDDNHLYGFDLKRHVKVSEWTLTCPIAPKGLALSGNGLAFIGCGGGAALTISLKDGHEVSRLAVGDGVDIVSYDAAAHRLYVPGAKAATLTIAKVAPDGKLTKLRELTTTARAHCVVAHAGVVLVCDPPHGRLLRLDDP